MGQQIEDPMVKYEFLKNMEEADDSTKIKDDDEEGDLSSMFLKKIENVKNELDEFKNNVQMFGISCDKELTELGDNIQHSSPQK